MQSKRQFEIIYILMNRKLVTAKELAEHFGISQRTVYRDIDVLGLAGIPVYTEKGKGGGICLLPEFVLNKSLLDEQEQNEILSALHEELQPAPGIESRFVETMALAEWRRLRLMCLEKEQLAMEIRRQQSVSFQS